MTHPAIAAESELRRLHAENAYLKTGYDASRLEVESLKHRVDEVGRIARENRSRAIVDLEAQISKRDFAIECYEKDLDTIKAALSAAKYPGSKDWREGSTLERIQWLHDYYQGGREEIERLTADVLNLQAMLDAVGAGGVESLRRGKCLHQITEPEQEPVLYQRRLGGLYRIVCEAVDLSMHSHGLQVVYRNIETGECWVRPKSEFHDGRFKRVPVEHVVDANKAMGAPNRWLTTV